MIGMLWFDNDPKMSLEKKIQGAIDYYAKKYGKVPDTVYVHPSMVPPEWDTSPSISVKTSKTVLKNHFFVGVEGKSE